MKILISGAVLLLMFTILSFGMPTFANAQSIEFPLTVSTDFPGYAENSEIIISGKVKESSLSEYPQPVTLMIVSPDGNIVKIDQLNLNSSNEFFTTLVAEKKKVIVYPIYESWHDLGQKNDNLGGNQKIKN